MLKLGSNWVLGLALVSGLALAGCSDDDKTTAEPCDTEHDFDRVYNQIDRLGNPLVSEVLFEKREHSHHNSTGPATDESKFTDDLVKFVTTVAGRTADNNAVANTLVGVLLPDVLTVQPAKTNVGWLSWALDPTNGYGGRPLGQDVVDIALGALFGDILNADQTIPALTSDNVDGNDKTLGTTFPYLATPH